MTITGPVKLDKKTKNLTNRLQPGDIALIDHEDLDEMAARSLASKKVGAVVNCASFVSGKYPNQGPHQLLKHQIPLFQLVEGTPFRQLLEGDQITLQGKALYRGDEKICAVLPLSREQIETALAQAEENVKDQLDAFIDNTLYYAAKEKQLILEPAAIPETALPIKGNHVLVVVRGKNYQEDLAAIQSYIREVKPILIGVDGGGDALLEFSLKPHLVIGDMDSVSDQCLALSQEIIVHAYPNGAAPGLKRVEELGLKASLFPSPGTSEDIAMLFAYQLGAALIVMVGTHTHMIDFLEKGRKGMGSTILVRMKIGTRLVDAKGVSQLYSSQAAFRHLLYIGMASLVPIVLIVVLSQPFRYLFRILRLRLRLYLGF